MGWLKIKQFDSDWTRSIRGLGWGKVIEMMPGRLPAAGGHRHSASGLGRFACCGAALPSR